jgi:hypothetical protein
VARIVTYAHRYKRPPRKRQAAALEVPAVVKVTSKWTTRPQPAPANPEPAAPPTPTNDPKPAPPPTASAIVTIRRRKHAMLAHLLEDLTPEEVQRRGDAADALFRTIVRRATGKDRP